jgi:hypothetical protein
LQRLRRRAPGKAGICSIGTGSAGAGQAVQVCGSDLNGGGAAGRIRINARGTCDDSGMFSPLPTFRAR